jgi:hypothetical protein
VKCEIARNERTLHWVSADSLVRVDESGPRPLPNTNGQQQEEGVAVMHQDKDSRSLDLSLHRKQQQQDKSDGFAQHVQREQLQSPTAPSLTGNTVSCIRVCCARVHKVLVTFSI